MFRFARRSSILRRTASLGAALGLLGAWIGIDAGHSHSHGDAGHGHHGVTAEHHVTPFSGSQDPDAQAEIGPRDAPHLHWELPAEPATGPEGAASPALSSTRHPVPASLVQIKRLRPAADVPLPTSRGSPARLPARGPPTSS